MSGYALHPEAFIDIDEIAAYIGEHNPEAAHRVVDEIYRAIESVAPFPHRGHRRPDLTGRALRFIRVRDYLIAYAFDKNPVCVIAVMHGHRSPRVMAAILRGREDLLRQATLRSYREPASARPGSSSSSINARPICRNSVEGSQNFRLHIDSS